jgi:hypothetical protein
VAIVSSVEDDEIEIIQQNPGKYVSSRATYTLKVKGGEWKVENKRIPGWLRKQYD